MNNPPSTQTATHSLHAEILARIEQIVKQADAETRPLELDPARKELFELFVTAHGAGFLDEESQYDLTADVLCKQLAQRWGLAEAAQTSVAQQRKLDPQELGHMRLLWSLMRMWMEWTYAWERWEEFHPSTQPETP